MSALTQKWKWERPSRISAFPPNADKEPSGYQPFFNERGDAGIVGAALRNFYRAAPFGQQKGQRHRVSVILFCHTAFGVVVGLFGGLIGRIASRLLCAFRSGPGFIIR